MEISSNAQTAGQTAAAPRAETPTSSALSSDFETFLRMLTTQMENQDPLNPLEASDFAVQLATFSGVEQQIRTNNLLAELVNGSGASEIAQLAGWVGMEARVSAPAVFSGTPITIAPIPEAAADSANLVVRDANGSIVSRENLPLSTDTIEWAGVDTNGAPLAPGTYTFEVESRVQGEVIATRSIEHYASVREARIGDNGIEIVLAGGAVVETGDVTGLRSPRAASSLEN